jgi:hypothetical protein
MPKPVLKPMRWKDVPESLRGYSYLYQSGNTYYIRANGYTWNFRWDAGQLDRLLHAAKGLPPTGCPYATPRHNAYYTPCGSKGVKKTTCSAHLPQLSLWRTLLLRLRNRN